MAADALARIALTSHLITSSQAPEITRRIQNAPERDEVDVLAEVVRFSPDQTAGLRRKMIAQRAARTFSVERGEFVLDDPIELAYDPEVAIDFRHVIYLGSRLNLAEQRLVDDLRQLGSQFVLKPDAVDDLGKYGFEPAVQPVLEALKVGTSLPQLEAAHRDIDPRSTQAVIYALLSCSAFAVGPRTTTLQPSAPPRTMTTNPTLTSRTTTPNPNVGPRTTTTNPDLARLPTTNVTPRTTTTNPNLTSRTTTPNPNVTPRTTTTSNPDLARLPITNVTPRTSTLQPNVPRSTTLRGTPEETRPPAPRTTTPDPRTTTTQPPFASGTAMFSNPTPLEGRAPTTTQSPRHTAPTTPILSRTNTTSPTSYSSASIPDSGTNTPAAVRPRSTSDPASARTRTPLPTTRPIPSSPPTDMDRVVKPTTPPRIGPPTKGPAPGTRPPPLNRTVTPTDPGDAARNGFGDQRTPLPFGDQRTPAPFVDQRTPTGFGEQRTPRDQRTPTNPPQSRTSTGSGSQPTMARTSTDNAAAAAEAFKRGELAMKRDQPGEAVLEFKTACDLNPNEVDYAGMLAWSKFCAAGDKQAISIDTRKALERAVFKSNHPERARFYLGRVERMLGRDKEALRHFQEVLDIVPNHAEAAAEVRAIEARTPKDKRKR